MVAGCRLQRDGTERRGDSAPGFADLWKASSVNMTDEGLHGWWGVAVTCGKTLHLSW